MSQDDNPLHQLPGVFKIEQDPVDFSIALPRPKDRLAALLLETNSLSTVAGRPWLSRKKPVQEPGAGGRIVGPTGTNDTPGSPTSSFPPSALLGSASSPGPAGSPVHVGSVSLRPIAGLGCKMFGAECLEQARERAELRTDADLEAAINMLVGFFYARYLTGQGVPSDWPKRVVAALLDGLRK
jgi:hypothetical protein